MKKSIADLFAKTLEFSRPVHLNVPLEEPLSDFVNQPSIKVKSKIKYTLKNNDLTVFDKSSYKRL